EQNDDEQRAAHHGAPCRSGSMYISSTSEPFGGIARPWNTTLLVPTSYDQPSLSPVSCGLTRQRSEPPAVQSFAVDRQIASVRSSGVAQASVVVTSSVFRSGTLDSWNLRLSPTASMPISRRISSNFGLQMEPTRPPRSATTSA